MERTLSTVAGCTQEVRIELTEAELKPHFESAYQRAQAGITLAGFRKGKVPIPIIKQRFARDIENDALDTIADEEFRSFATAEKLRVVGNPSLTDIQKASGGVAFTVRFDVMPEFELGAYRGLVLDRHVKTITEDDVQREVDRICLRAASFEPAEQVTDTMFVATIAMHELDRDTSMPIIGAEAREERVFLDDDNVDMHLRSSLANTKVGDTFSYVAETEDEQQQPGNFRVTVSDIQRVLPAEFNNEFVEIISSSRFHTTEELRADIERQIGEYFDQASRDNLEQQVVDQLVGAHSLEVPEPLVHAVIHQLFEDFKKRNEGAPGIEGVTAHDVEPQFRPSAERIVRWELIRDKIITAEEISISDEDVVVAAGRFGIPEDQLRLVMRQNASVEDRLLAEKAVKTILDYAIINDVNVDSEESVM